MCFLDASYITQQYNQKNYNCYYVLSYSAPVVQTTKPDIGVYTYEATNAESKLGCEGKLFEN